MRMRTVLKGVTFVLLLAGVVAGFNLWVDKTFVVNPALALNARSPTITR